MKDLFPIKKQNGTHRVDSRLIANSLGINHTDWMSNLIKKHLQVIENQFDKVVFKTENPINRGGRPTKFAYLTENQAIFIATLSRNTERVINFKVKLVKSFAAARHQLQQKGIATHRPALENPLTLLQLKIAQKKQRLEWNKTALKAAELSATLADMNENNPHWIQEAHWHLGQMREC